jgi:hypothetical protein
MAQARRFLGVGGEGGQRLQRLTVRRREHVSVQSQSAAQRYRT